MGDQKKQNRNPPSGCHVRPRPIAQVGYVTKDQKNQTKNKPQPKFSTGSQPSQKAGWTRHTALNIARCV